MSHGAEKDCKSATTRSAITTGLRPVNFPSLGKGTKAPKSQYEPSPPTSSLYIHLQGRRTSKIVEPRTHILVGASFVERFHGSEKSMRRVSAEYAQIFFPGSAAGIPGTLASLGNLGSAAGIPWSAPGSVRGPPRRSKRPSQARPWGVHKRTRPNDAIHEKRLRKRNRLGTEQFQTHLHTEFLYSKVDAVTVCQAE